MRRLDVDFFSCNSEALARKLIGKLLCVCGNGVVNRYVITETEAYGLDDSACHCHKGRTKRNDPMFNPGGTVYVYLCYGLHEILNVSAGGDGEGQGVMIRGIDDVIGPGKVTKKLGITRSLNYEFVPTSDKIWIESGQDIDGINIECLKRVGINYATQKDQDRLWRFRYSK